MDILHVFDVILRVNIKTFDRAAPSRYNGAEHCV